MPAQKSENKKQCRLTQRDLFTFRQINKDKDEFRIVIPKIDSSKVKKVGRQKLYDYKQPKKVFTDYLKKKNENHFEEQLINLIRTRQNFMKTEPQEKLPRPRTSE